MRPGAEGGLVLETLAEILVAAEAHRDFIFSTQYEKSELEDALNAARVESTARSLSSRTEIMVEVDLEKQQAELLLVSLRFVVRNRNMGGDQLLAGKAEDMLDDYDRKANIIDIR